jgi:hypothetical protein
MQGGFMGCRKTLFLSVRSEHEHSHQIACLLRTPLQEGFSLSGIRSLDIVNDLGNG